MIRARILIVEDEAILAADLEQMLNALGHEVVGTVSSGPAALIHLKSLNPELILLDINLRGSIDGIETARILNEMGADVPVIFLTSYSDRETVARASDTEPFGYLLKPFDESLIRITIELALHKHRMEALRRELANTKEEVKLLSGLLPICSHCKKIRNDSGYWEQIDAYISKRTDTQFSHGICSGCFEEHHPEIQSHLIELASGQGEGI